MKADILIKCLLLNTYLKVSMNSVRISRNEMTVDLLKYNEPQSIRSVQSQQI